MPLVCADAIAGQSARQAAPTTIRANVRMPLSPFSNGLFTGSPLGVRRHFAAVVPL